MLVGRRREMGRETSYTTTAHWTCAFCGALVGHGDYHVCAGSAPLAPIAPVVMNRDAEIIGLLQGILGILELFAEDKGFIRLD